MRTRRRPGGGGGVRAGGDGVVREGSGLWTYFDSRLVEICDPLVRWFG